MGTKEFCGAPKDESILMNPWEVAYRGCNLNKTSEKFAPNYKSK